MQLYENSAKEKNNLDIKSPYELNEYIKVAKPSIWIILTSVSILIVSIFIWALFGTIEDKVEAVAFIKDYKCEIFIAKKDYARVRRGMKLEIENHEFTIMSIAKTPKELDKVYFSDDSNVGNFKIFDQVYQIEVDKLEDASFTTGTYNGSIVVRRIHPISFFKI